MTEAPHRETLKCGWPDLCYRARGFDPVARTIMPEGTDFRRNVPWPL